MRARIIAATWILALALPAVAADFMKAGKWEATVVIEAANATGTQVPPIVVVRCITPAEAADPKPAAPAEGDECAITDYKVDGRTVSWTLSCRSRNLVGRGSITYADETYAGSMELTVGDRVTTHRYSGKRLGECDTN